MFLHHLLLSTQCLPRWGLEGHHLNRDLKHLVEPEKKKVTLRRRWSCLLKPPQMRCTGCQSLSPPHQGQQLHLSDVWHQHHLAYGNVALPSVGFCTCFWVRCSALWDWAARQRRDTWYSLDRCQGHMQHFATASPSAALELKQWRKHFHKPCFTV